MQFTLQDLLFRDQESWNLLLLNEGVGERIVNRRLNYKIDIQQNTLGYKIWEIIMCIL